MKRPILLLVLMFLLPAAYANTGSNPELTRGQEKRLFRQTMKLIYKGQHRHAEANLLTLLDASPDNIHYNYELALLYYYDLNQTDKSVQYFEAVKRLRSEDEYFEIFYYLGQAYQFIGEYDKALAEYEYFKRFIIEKDVALLEEVARYEEECENAKEIAGNNVTRVRNLGNRINTSFAEYVPVPILHDSVLLFTSKRPPVISTHYGFEGSIYYEKVYLSMKQGSGYTFAEISSNNEAFRLLENSKKWHNAVVSSSLDGNTLMIYRKSKLWTSAISEGIWQPPVRVSKVVNFSFYQPHASLTADGGTIYFSSWSKKGQGGIDIYRSQRKKDGSWGPTENLGPVINTKYDEDSPEISPDGTCLYFSSKGHRGTGGYDIFKAELKDGVWSEPVNMGYPVNSPGDDIFFKLTEAGNIAYFSSYRKDGFGDMDIYAAIFGPLFEDCKPVAKKDHLADFYIGFDAADSVLTGESLILDGSISYSANHDLTKFFWNLNQQELITDSMQIHAKYDCPGKYIVKLEVEAVDRETKEATSYCVSREITVTGGQQLIASNDNTDVTDNNMNNNNDNTDVSDNNNTTDNTDLTDNTSNPPSVLKLDNVYFDFDKTNIRTDAKATLDKNISMLKEYRDGKIRIYAHTDSRGPASYNQLLSEKRAASVKEYLVSNGVDASRIIEVEGKGETRLVNNCTDDSACSKDDHQKNRRAELEVVL